jgi:hypothetical protein
VCVCFSLLFSPCHCLRYLTVVLAVGRFLRISLTGLATRIVYVWWGRILLISLFFCFFCRLLNTQSKRQCFDNSMCGPLKTWRRVFNTSRLLKKNITFLMHTSISLKKQLHFHTLIYWHPSIDTSISPTTTTSQISKRRISHQKTPYYLSKTPYFLSKNTIFPIKNTAFPIKKHRISYQKHRISYQNTVFPIKNTAFPIKKPYFLSKNTTFLPKNTAFPIKNTVFPIKKHRISPQNASYEDLPHADRLLGACEDLRLCREDRRLDLERRIYEGLVRVYREPKRLVRATERPKMKQNW